MKCHFPSARGALFTLALCACDAASGAGDFGATRRASDGGGAGTPAEAGKGGGGAGGSTSLVIAPSTSPPVMGGSAGGASIVATLPPGFTQTEIGGFQLGEALDGSAAAGGAAGDVDACSNVLLGVVRDFRGRDHESGLGHPDFQGPFWGSGPTPGLVAPLLGGDDKPVYASKCEEGSVDAVSCPYGQQTSSGASFDQWFRYTPEVNQPFVLRLYFAPQDGGLFTFRSNLFFPLDGAGFGNTAGVVGDDGGAHNFSFTTELHTRFQYVGGETFTFDGDDDVWVFINGHLAVDLGGLHAQSSSSVSLDERAAELGLVQGEVYGLDLFHAERHDTGSNFRIDSNLSFVGCGTLPPDVVVR